MHMIIKPIMVCLNLSFPGNKTTGTLQLGTLSSTPIEKKTSFYNFKGIMRHFLKLLWGKTLIIEDTCHY